MASPISFIASEFMDDARTICSLSPVARTDIPTCVRKNHASTATPAAVSIISRTPLLIFPGKKESSEYAFALPAVEYVLLPIIIRFTEYSPVMVSIPARIGCMRSLV